MNDEDVSAPGGLTCASGTATIGRPAKSAWLSRLGGPAAILCATALMAFQDAVVKLLSSGVALWQLFLVRSLLVIPFLVWLIGRAGLERLRPAISGWVLLRSGLLVAMYVWFYAALPVIDLSVVAAVYYTGPLLIVVFSALLLRERVTVIVDHIGLVEVQASSDNTRISMITGALKGFAMECEVPVIALSQLNRQVEGRDDKRPRLSDLRDSGSIEQDADNVLFCYRPEYYLERAEPDASDQNARIAWEIKLESARGLLEIGVAKQRNGPVGTVKIGCELAHNYIYERGA